MYEIIINKTELKDVRIMGKHEILSERLVTAEEIKAADYDDAPMYEKALKGGRLPMVNVYGYTPDITKPKEVEVEVFRQKVDELDMETVIKAINGIG